MDVFGPSGNFGLFILDHRENSDFFQKSVRNFSPNFPQNTVLSNDSIKIIEIIDFDFVKSRKKWFRLILISENLKYYDFGWFWFSTFFFKMILISLILVDFVDGVKFWCRLTASKHRIPLKRRRQRVSNIQCRQSAVGSRLQSPES